jgi:signal transduction histidine kinase
MKVQQAYRLMRIKGTGLGLAEVKQIVGQHGGAIDVDSEFGCDTSIAIRLPLKPEMRVAA